MLLHVTSQAFFQLRAYLFFSLIFNLVDPFSNQNSLCLIMHLFQQRFYLFFPLLTLKYRKLAEQMIPTAAISHMIIISGNGIIMNSRFSTVRSLGGLLSEKAESDILADYIAVKLRINLI